MQSSREAHGPNVENNDVLYARCDISTTNIWLHCRWQTGLSRSRQGWGRVLAGIGTWPGSRGHKNIHRNRVDCCLGAVCHEKNPVSFTKFFQEVQTFSSKSLVFQEKPCISKVKLIHHRENYLLAPPFNMDCCSSIKKAYFLCLGNDKSFNFSSCKRGGGTGFNCYMSCYMVEEKMTC